MKLSNQSAPAALTVQEDPETSGIAYKQGYTSEIHFQMQQLLPDVEKEGRDLCRTGRRSEV